MAQATGREELFYKILIFFAVITAITSIFNLANTNEISLGDFGGGVLAGQFQSTHDLTTGVLPGQDFTTSTGYDPNISFKTSGNSTWLQVDGAGYQCIAIPAWPLFQPAMISIIGVTQISGNYTMEYNIFNPISSDDFYIMVWSNGLTDGEWIQFTESGISLRRLGPLGMGLVQQTLGYYYASSSQKIKTVYNRQQNYVDVTVGDQYIGRLNNVATPDYLDVDYGGVATYHTGFIFVSADGTISPKTSEARTVTSLWDAVFDGFNLVATALGITRDPLIPFWLWAIFGLPSLSALAFIQIEVIRGV